MKAGLILRIGIHLVGVWSLYSGLTAAVYYGHSALADRPGDLLGAPSYASALFGYAVLPLLFALMCFGFAGAITRLLLGSLAQESLEGFRGGPFARGCVKILALYLLGIFGAPLVATIYELAAVRSGNRTFMEAQVTSDLISNGLGVGFGLWLGLRTERVIAMFFPKEEKV